MEESTKSDRVCNNLLRCVEIFQGHKESLWVNRFRKVNPDSLDAPKKESLEEAKMSWKLKIQ